MAKLIDVNTAKEPIINLLENEWGYEGIREDVRRIFDKAPTVDAVEVVRCKDCQMWKCHGMPFDITKGTCRNPIFHFHHGHVIDECFMPVTNETDFCSYGERREGE